VVYDSGSRGIRRTDGVIGTMFTHQKVAGGGADSAMRANRTLGMMHLPGGHAK
jgi:hypothetical protein